MSAAVIKVEQGLQVERDGASAVVGDRVPAGAKLSRADVAEFEWFFGVAPSLFWHSNGTPSDMMSPHEIMRAGYEYRRVRADKITAYPTAEYRNVRGVEPDSATLCRFGRMSSSVLALSEGSGSPDGRALGEVYVAVFKTYFGNDGNVWEQLAVSGGEFEVKRKPGPVDADGNEIVPGEVIYEEPVPGERARLPGKVPAIRVSASPNAGHRAHGRIGSLYALTRGGQLLLEYSAKLAKRKGQPVYDFGDQVRMQLELRSGYEKLTEEQRALLARAQRESRSLFVSACFAWNRVRAREGVR